MAVLCAARDGCGSELALALIRTGAPTKKHISMQACEAVHRASLQSGLGCLIVAAAPLWVRPQAVPAPSLLGTCANANTLASCAGGTALRTVCHMTNDAAGLCSCAELCERQRLGQSNFCNMGYTHRNHVTPATASLSVSLAPSCGGTSRPVLVPFTVELACAGPAIATSLVNRLGAQGMLQH